VGTAGRSGATTITVGHKRPSHDGIEAIGLAAIAGLSRDERWCDHITGEAVSPVGTSQPTRTMLHMRIDLMRYSPREFGVGNYVALCFLVCIACDTMVLLK
jgi:hypothetical protein